MTTFLIRYKTMEWFDLQICTAYQVTDPTICRSECRISDLWVFGYRHLLSNLLCGGGATMLYFVRPMLLDYKVYQADNPWSCQI